MNFVVLTAIISAANSGLYASTRMLWSLANEGTIPAIIAKTNKRGIPVFALLLSMLGGVLALLSSIYAAGTVYLVLVSVSGLAVVFVWIAISLCELIFRRRFLAAGHQLSELKYRTPWYPVVPWFAFIASSLSCILIWFDPQQRIALYCTIPFVIACYAAYYLQTLWRKYTTKKKVSTVVK